MNKYLYLIVLLGFAVASCSQENTQSDDESDTSLSSIASDTTTISLPGMTKEELAKAMFNPDKAFYRTYAGTIGDRKIEANLIKVDNEVSGSYYYVQEGKPISVKSRQLTQDGYFEIVETTTDTRETTGTFTGRFIGDKVEAIWQNAEKTKKLATQMAVVKQEAEQSMTAEIFYQKTIDYYIPNDTTSPHYVQIYSVILPSENYSNPVVATLYDSLEGIFGKALASGNPIKSLENLRQQSMKTYRESLKPLIETEGLVGLPSLNWSSITKTEVVYNTRGILSCAWDDYYYTGGAHGNYGRSYQAYNLATGKPIELSDVFTDGYEEMIKPLLINGVREVKGLKADQSLEDEGFYPEFIKPTDNFYLTHKGIGFYYEPYEIAAYAFGETEIFIPFSKCQKFLQPNTVWMQEAVQ